MLYRVKSEFLDRWTNEPVDELIVNDNEICRLALEWDTDDPQGLLNSLYDQVEEVRYD